MLPRFTCSYTPSSELHSEKQNTIFHPLHQHHEPCPSVFYPINLVPKISLFQISFLLFDKPAFLPLNLNFQFEKPVNGSKFI
jgi:hypothetical protein